MTREAFGLVGLDAGLLAVGEALLLGVGLVRDVRSAVRFAGLALLVGFAATGLAVSFALMAGLEPTVSEVVVLWGLLVGVGVVLALRVPGRPLPALRERGVLGRVIAGAGALLLLLAVVELCRRTLASGPLDPDAWAFWLPKAKTIVYFGGLDTHAGGFTSYPHPDYPPLVPAMEAVSFRFLGRVDPLMLPIQHWVVAVGFLAGLAGLLAARVRPAILWPSLAMLAFMPSFEHLIGSSLGDEPLLELVTLAAVCAALWLLDDDWRCAALAGLFLAAGALAKNEGFMLAVAIVLMLVLVRRGRWLTLEAIGASPLVALAAWKLWLSANDVAVPDADYRFRDVFDPGYLGDHASRLSTAFRALPGYVLDPGALLLAVPLTLALAVLLLAVRGERRVAVFGLGTIVLAYLGYLAIYWIGRPEIHFYLDSSAGRIVTPLGVFAAALFPLLLAEAMSGRQSGA